MILRVRLFAILRERAGADHVEVDLPTPATAADVLTALAELPGLGALHSGSARIAVNREYAAPDAPITATDELAVIPPVSGGDAGTVGRLEHADGAIHACLTAEPLALESLVRFVADPSAGALVSFQGMPRDVPALEYEAYGEMALSEIVAILTGARREHGLTRAAAEHRVGPVPTLEASIAIAVSAPHREAAFDGAREILDRIKAQAPIWKVEVAIDGSRTRIPGRLPDGASAAARR